MKRVKGIKNKVIKKKTLGKSIVFNKLMKKKGEKGKSFNY
jgi:hypothetical protein